MMKSVFGGNDVQQSVFETKSLVGDAGGTGLSALPCMEQKKRNETVTEAKHKTLQGIIFPTSKY